MPVRECHARLMGADRDREPLLRGRGALRVEDFCRSTGLDEDTVDDLIRSGRLEGVLWTATEPSRPVAIFDDQLPSPEDLAAMGLPVRSDYDPAALRSFELPDDDEGGASRH